MPRLLQINIVSNVLSTGLIVEDIAKIASSRGWDCYVAYGRYSKPGICKEIKVGNVIYTYEHYIESRLFDNEGLASRLATKKLIKTIVKIHPDVIHLHNLHDHYINYRLLFEFLNSTNIKVVWTFHDFWAITGHCHHFVDANCNKWKKNCYKCPLQHSSVNSFLDRSTRNFNLKKNLFSANKRMTIVPVSYWVGEMLNDSFLKDCRKIVIPNGIDITKFESAERVYNPLIPNNKFVILGVAKSWSFGDRKGLDDYIKLAKLLNNDEVIVLVGLKDNQIKQMPNNIIGIERTLNQEELINIYRQSNVLLSLSGAETFGLTILEANACGVPAIVYNNTAPPLLIKSSTGYVAENKNINDVYDKIQIVKRKGKTFYSQACVDNVRNNYNKNINYQKYIDLYEELGEREE